MSVNKRLYLQIAAGLLGVLSIAWSITVLAEAPFIASWVRQADTVDMPDGPGYGGWMDMFYDPLAQRGVTVFGSAPRYTNHIFHYEAASDIWMEVEPYVLCQDILDFVPPYPQDEQSSDYDALNHLYWSTGGSGYKCKSKYPRRTTEAGTDSSTVVDSTLVGSGIVDYADWTVEVGNTKAYVQSYNSATGILVLATPIAGLKAGSSYIIHPQRGGGTWYYSPSTSRWGSLDGPHWAYVGDLPTNRFSAAFAYSTKDQAFVMFGGGPADTTDTWILDAQTRTWLPMIAANDPDSPPGRAEVGNSMVYDEVHDVFILFGGRCTDPGLSRCERGTSLADTWIYDLGTNTWTEVTPPVSPPSRERHAMAYDSANGIVLMFAGQRCFGTQCLNAERLNDLWAYDYATNTWSNITPADTNPTPRYLSTMIYDPIAGAAVVWTGKDSRSRPMRETWMLRVVPNGSINLPPVAIAEVAPAATGTTATVFQFDATGSTDDSGIVSYLWSFGDGTTSGLGIAAHTYSVPGAYSVSLTVIDQDGVSDSTTIPIGISFDTPPQIVVAAATVKITVDDPTVSQILVNGVPSAVNSGVIELPLTLDPPSTSFTLEGTNASGATTTKTLTITVE
jgi:hypothetical protein